MLSKMVDDLYRTAVRQYQESLDNFLYECIIELGFEGFIGELEKAKKFIDENGIYIEDYYDFSKNIRTIRVNCPDKNYSKEKEFCIKFKECE